MRQWIIASLAIAVPFCVAAAVYSLESSKPAPIKLDPERAAGAVTWRAQPSAYNRAQPAKAWRLQIAMQQPTFNFLSHGFPDYNQCARAINWTAIGASNGRMKVKCVETGVLVEGAQ